MNMVLAINIGNSNIALGLWKDGLIHQTRVPTADFRDGAWIRSRLENLTGSFGGAVSGIRGCVIASVVPGKTRLITDCVTEIIGRPPMTVDQSTDYGMDISAYDNRLLGSDRVVCCVSALTKYQPPLVVFDLGTATTANVIDASGAFLGGIIMPGVRLGLSALSGNTALLPHTEPGPDVHIIGRNTAECLAAGAVYGAASSIEGLVSRISESLGQRVTVIITGGNADMVIPYCRIELFHEPALLLEGLVSLYMKRE